MLRALSARAKLSTISICMLLAVEEETTMADRRAGPRQGPYVKSKGGGIQPRARNKDGSWRAKRADAGKSRSASRG